MNETARDGARRLSAGVMARGFSATGLYEYRTADGELNYCRMRADNRATGEKWIRPMRCNKATGKWEIGEPTPPESGKPLYRLPAILAAPIDSTVFVVEGEKCADRLACCGVVTTTSGGSTSAKDADWAPLRGRHVVIWQDNDDAGAKYAEDVLAALRKIGAASVELVDVSTLRLDDKGDCVDWMERRDNVTAEDVLTLARYSPPDIDAIPATQPIGQRKLPDLLPPVPVLDPLLLPDSVRAWCMDTADGLNLPLDFAAIPAMVGLAGAIGRKIAIAMKEHGHWYEHSVLWGCVIGRPSSGKTPALSPVRRMLNRLEDAEREQYELDIAAFQRQQILNDAKRENARKALSKAVKDGNMQQADSLADDMRKTDDGAPTEPRLVINDSTVEMAGELLRKNPQGLILYRDELTAFTQTLDKQGHEGDRAFWLECWNGHGGFTVDRIGRGTVRIEACAVSILGGMQPGKLREYVGQAVGGGFGDDGLMQRFQLAVYPDLSANWKYTDRQPDPAAELKAWQAFRMLRNLDSEAIGAERNGVCSIPFLRLSRAAQSMFIEWQEQLMPRLRADTEPPWMESHLAKYPSLVGRLCLVLHLADGGTGPVPDEVMARALGWCDHLESHARRFYAPADNGGLWAAHALRKKLKDLSSPFTARDVYRRNWAGLGDSETVNEALELLAEYGHLCAKPGAAENGRPTRVYFKEESA